LLLTALALHAPPAQVVWNYTSIFFSRTWTLAERVEAAAFVLHFLRIWRSWLLHSSDYNIAANFISRQCYQDITISVHNVVLLIRYKGMYCLVIR
jgi:predicted alpha/beta hydrolase